MRAHLSEFHLTCVTLSLACGQGVILSLAYLASSLRLKSSAGVATYAHLSGGILTFKILMRVGGIVSCASECGSPMS